MRISHLILFLFALVLSTALLSGLIPHSAEAAGREEAAAKSAAPRLEKKLGQKFKLGDPVFLRIIKEEAALEVWMLPSGSDKFFLLHTYPICAFSGGLGPKTKQGDRKAPEGVYAVGLRHLNPFSSYHLSFDLGYPNAYDRAQGYTGSLLMVHGDCRSDGCYAMTDQGIEEIYTLVKAALDNGQPFFRVHIFPFRFTAENLKKYESHEWHNFWQMLEPIYAYFEKHRVPPEVKIENSQMRVVRAGLGLGAFIA